MKYSAIIFLIAFLSFIVPDKNRMTINGVYKIAPKTGEKVYLAILIDAKTKKRQFIDSASVTGNRFFFDLKGVQPGKYEMGNSEGKYFSIYLDYCQSRIIVDSLFERARVRGNSTDSLIKKYDQCQSGLGLIQFGAAIMSQKYKKDGKEIPDSMIQKLQGGITNLTAVRKDLSRKTGLRKDLAAAYVLSNGGADQFTTKEMNDIYAGMPVYVKNAPYGVSFKTFLDKVNNLEVGVKAPDFTQQSPEGGDIRLADFVKGKKLVLIDFWASWCGPCRKENPNVVALYNRFKQQGFGILSVSLDSKKEDWLKAIADDKLIWMHVSDLGGWKNSVAKLYNVSAVPHTLLLDGNGTIIAKDLRGKELAAKVEEICR